MQGQPQRNVFKEKNMLTVQEFARLLPCSVRHAYNLVERGRDNGGILAYRFGDRNGIRIPQSEADRFRSSRVVSEA